MGLRYVSCERKSREREREGGRAPVPEATEKNEIYELL